MKVYADSLIVTSDQILNLKNTSLSWNIMTIIRMA
jgi:hypothetical protein